MQDLKPTLKMRTTPKKRERPITAPKYERVIMGAFDSKQGCSFWKKVKRGHYKTIDCPEDILDGDGSVENYFQDSQFTHIMCDDTFINNHFNCFNQFLQSVELLYKPILLVETGPNNYSQDPHNHIFLIHINIESLNTFSLRLFLNQSKNESVHEITLGDLSQFFEEGISHDQ